jgi:hypothetical protein
LWTDHADRTAQRATDAIKFPHSESVAIPRDIERLGKSGTLDRLSSEEAVLDKLASNPFHSITREIELLSSRNPSSARAGTPGRLFTR